MRTQKRLLLVKLKTVLCTADSVVGAEPVYLPGTATCASACASEALLHIILLYFTSTVKQCNSKRIFHLLKKFNITEQ